MNFKFGYIADYKPFNFVDGYGVRCSLYVSGCTHKCNGCFNKAAWDFNYGTPYSLELESKIIKDLSQSYVQGLTLLGGEPFLNLQTCLNLAKKVKKEFLKSKDIWIYSGFLYEEILKDKNKFELLKICDILVDGKFIISQKELNLEFKGSLNQRIIDIKSSLKSKNIVLWNKNCNL